MKEFYVFTCEHRKYKVKARNRHEANIIITNGNLDPKDKRFTLEEFGDFKIEES